MLTEQEQKNVEEEIAELERYNSDPTISAHQRYVNNQRLFCLYHGYRLEPVPMQPRLVQGVHLATGTVLHTFSYLDLLYGKFDLVDVLREKEVERSSSLVVKKEGTSSLHLANGAQIDFQPSGQKTKTLHGFRLNKELTSE